MLAAKHIFCTFVMMAIMDHTGRPTSAVQLLLHEVTGVSDAMIDRCRILPRSRNWLRFPWYSKHNGGGGFVMGDRIYVSSNLLRDHNNCRRSLLLLLAHEVGHLPHAAAFANKTWGALRFVLWSTGQYLGSFLRHGSSGYRMARIEQEAERGRWVLRELLGSAGNAGSVEVLRMIDEEDNTALSEWLNERTTRISGLHRAYAGW